MTYVGCARIQAVLREEAQQMRIVVAPQEFKGTLSSREAAEAMGEGARRAVPDATIELAPLSDGGPGLVEVVLAAARRTTAARGWRPRWARGSWTPAATFCGRGEPRCRNWSASMSQAWIRGSSAPRWW